VRRAAHWQLAIGVLLLAAVLASRDLPKVLALLGVAGDGLLIACAFHLLPLVLDALAIRVLISPHALRRAVRATVLARWVGESGNSLLLGGQIGGPVLMARHLAQHGLSLTDSAAAVTVSTTLQALAQIAFAAIGGLLLVMHTDAGSRHGLAIPLGVGAAVLLFTCVPFYFVQRRGLFTGITRLVRRFSSGAKSPADAGWAQATDEAIRVLYGRTGRLAASFGLSLVGWLVGTGEVYLLLDWLGSPVGWLDALLLESVGQGIRGAGFAIPGSLGIQEGGYVLLAPVVGLSPDTALGLALGKRAREILLGVPGLAYLQLNERVVPRQNKAAAPGTVSEADGGRPASKSNS
jgi:putative membrane protein